MFDLNNKTALVTGGSRGIGRATVLALANAGAHVIVHYNQAADEANAVVDEIRTKGGKADAVRADLAQPGSPAKLAEEVKASRREDGRFVLEQETNAYAVLPYAQWRGYRPPAEPPAPQPGTWGDHPALPSVLAQAAAERREGGTLRQIIGILDSDPTDALAAALARLGQAVQKVSS